MVTPLRADQLAPDGRRGPLLPPPPRPPHPDRVKNQRREAMALLVVGLALAAVGVGFARWASSSRRLAARLKESGSAVTATVAEVRTVSLRGSGVVGHIVDYSFELDGQSVEGRNDVRGHDQRELWEPLVPGIQAPARYDPADTTLHMLEAEIEDELADWPWYWFGWVIAAAGLAALGLAVANVVSVDAVYAEGVETLGRITGISEVDGIATATVTWSIAGAEQTSEVRPSCLASPAFKELPGYDWLVPVTELSVGDDIALLVRGDLAEVISREMVEGG